METTSIMMLLNLMLVFLNLLLVISNELNRRFYVKLYSRDIVQDSIEQVLMPLIDTIENINTENCNFDLSVIFSRKLGASWKLKIDLFKQVIPTRAKRKFDKIVKELTEYQEECPKLDKEARKKKLKLLVQELSILNNEILKEYYLSPENTRKRH